ncbi:putative membrane protein [Synechococcus sp. ROS8604]|nr:putative membrane protein [Synechococcus sp. ROS8604]
MRVFGVRRIGLMTLALILALLGSLMAMGLIIRRLERG